MATNRLNEQLQCRQCSYASSPSTLLKLQQTESSYARSILSGKQPWRNKLDRVSVSPFWVFFFFVWLVGISSSLGKVERKPKKLYADCVRNGGGI